VKVRFSRHARRRAKLYKIPISMIVDILKNMELSQGEFEIIKDVEEFKYPLKIVVAIEDDRATVVTVYPLKKRRDK
jgi:hypothetical protein